MNYRTILFLTTALIGSVGAASGASAQSTGTETAELGEIVVTGQRDQRTIGGLVTAESTGKSRSTVTQTFISTQAAGQTINEVLNLVPGMNFTSNDAYGSSGGNIRLHGFDGPRIAQTFDGMPLNDSGNYAIYPNQQLDGELIAKATVNTGTTDADSPTASATGGTINISSLTPSDGFDGWIKGSLGDFDYQRIMAFVNTGSVGPWGTRAWFAYTDQDYGKHRGLGELRKIQYNAKFYQPLGDNGDFVSLAAHWNRNRNNNIATLSLFRQADGSLGSSADTGAFGWHTDFLPTYTAPTFVNGAADNDVNTTNYWGLQINPSNTGNIRGQSRFTLMDGLRLTIDPSFQYVLANGGSQQAVLSETDALLRGSRTSGGVDLNGDGDTLDRVRVMTPSTTSTQRYGLISSLLWDLNPDHALRLAYTLDWARHRQTGAYGKVDFSNPTEPRFGDPFGGLTVEENRILNLDGYYMRARDRLSYAELNQVAFEYRGRLFDDRLRLSLGVRAPFFKRDMNQFCYSQRASSAVRCTTETPILQASGYHRFGTSTVDYIAPYSRTKTFDDVLPNINATWRFDGPHSVYASYAESLTLPRTDNLYTVIRGASGELVSPIIDPERSKTWDAGYRYQADTLIAAVNVWFTSFENRILSAYDPETDITTDRNIGNVDLMGVDAQVGFSPIEPLSLYLSASYNDNEIKSDYRSSPTTVIPVGGKSLVDVPEWTVGFSAEYSAGPFSAGLTAKYVAARWLTDINDLEVPDYTVVGANARLDLGAFGFEGSQAQINVSNLFDERYFGAITSTGITSASALGARQGAPRTIQASITYAF